jgi:endonuclease/exonuclease/phosphatase family metal-dependent hydrolase
MRMHTHGHRRRLTVAIAATIGASLLTVAAGGAADAETRRTYQKDPQILGERTSTSFVSATFNVLGHSHTAGSDPRPSGPARMKHSVQLLRENNVDLVGLQELETKQANAFKQLATEYELYSPPKDTRDSIAWRKDRFTLVSTDGVRIPYRENWRTMPIVVLRDKVTKRLFRVMSVHNVAGKEAKFVQRRATSVRLELDKIKAMNKVRPLPILTMGDFNDRTQPFYCQMLNNRHYSSSVWWTMPSCELPPRPQIDWIFGTPALRFTGYQRLDGGLVDQATDHPLILARVDRAAS